MRHIRRVDGELLRVVANYGSIAESRSRSPSVAVSGTAEPFLIDKTIHIHDLAAEIQTEFPEVMKVEQRSIARTMLVSAIAERGSADRCILSFGG